MFTYTDSVPPVDSLPCPPRHILVGELSLLGEGHPVEAILPHGASGPNPHAGQGPEEREAGEQVVEEHLTSWHQPSLQHKVHHNIGPLPHPPVLHPGASPAIRFKPQACPRRRSQAPNLSET